MSGSAPRNRYDTSTDPLRGAARREVASALGLLVILFNLVAGILLSSGAAPADAAMLGDTLGDRIVVCTGAGKIILDADGKIVPDTSGEQLCVFCLPLVQGSADAPVALAALDAPMAAAPAMWAADLRAGAHVPRRFSAASPRAPPLV